MQQYHLYTVCIYATLSIGCTSYTKLPEPDLNGQRYETEKTVPELTEREAEEQRPEHTTKPKEDAVIPPNPPSVQSPLPRKNSTKTLEKIVCLLSGTTLAIASALAQYRERPKQYL